MKRIVLTVGLAAIAAVAAAQDRAPVLHEYVDPPAAGSGGGSRVLDPRAAPVDPGADPSDTPLDPSVNPPAIRQADKLIPEPSKSTTRQPGEPVISQDVAPDRMTEVPMDRNTRPDGTLRYAEVFNPSVVPFKRMTALDAVHRDYTMFVSDPSKRPVPVGGSPEPDRDLFYGSMLVELDGDTPIPLPSVAPDMRILSYEVVPLTRLTFTKDSADNYYVEAEDPTTSGQFRLVFLADAPITYFAPVVPPGLSLRDIADAGMKPAPMPESVRSVARLVHQRLGVDGRQSLDVSLNKLIEYFRAFEAGPPPTNTNDIYWDLTLNQVGVCRHRAFAFMISANALGVPTRYVQNEAHAFAEVWLPRVGWLRVDLGGAALELEVSNAEDKAMYRPRGDDPFPKPPEYTDNYTRLRGDIEGLTADQIRDAQTPYDPDVDVDSQSTDPYTPSPTGLPRVDPDARETRAKVTIGVDVVESAAFRGDAIRVGGRVRGGSGGAGLTVQIYLAPEGRGTDQARLVAETVTGTDGAWSVAVELPADLGVGRHEVFAHTPGDAKRAPAISE